ncbi:succinate dehydrogenase assembly factor 2 [bacterium NHP-B]|nr:succinate dehydrogenase assembly factor 2 [bacterium NHP-B]
MSAAMKKRLHFKGTHRGMREADVLVGRFVHACLARAPEEVWPVLDAFLDGDDGELIKILTGGAPWPAFCAHLAVYSDG